MHNNDTGACEYLPGHKTLISTVRKYYSDFLRLVVLHFAFFFFQAEDGIRDYKVTGVQTCALPISDSTGNFIRKGEPLFEIYSQELVNLLKEYLAVLHRTPAGEQNTLPGKADAGLEIGRASCRERV